MRPRLIGGPSASFCATAMASSRRRSSSTTFQIRPHCSAVSAASGSPRSARARARATPIDLWRNKDVPPSSAAPESDETQDKSCGARRNHNIARQGDANSSSRSGSIHGDDNWNRQAAHFLDERVERASHTRGDAVTRGECVSSKLRPGAETLARAGDHNGPGTGFLKSRLERRIQIVQKASAERVVLLGIIERQDCD